MQGTPVKSCMMTRAGRELDLGVGLSRGHPGSEGLDLVLGDVRTVLGAKQVLEEHLQAEGQLLEAGHGVDTEDLIRLVADMERVLRPETVHCRHDVLSFADAAEHACGTPSSPSGRGCSSKGNLTGSPADSARTVCEFILTSR